ncbi:hypothetical protein LTR95_002287 [Oleoguttula sp. CCFEE 5521]
MSSSSAPTLTARQMELLSNILKCLKTKPEIHLAKFAEMSNVSLASASTIYSRTLKLVMNANGSEEGGDTDGTPKKGKKATPKKRKSTDEDGVGDDDEDATLTKKTKVTPRKWGKKVLQAEQDGEAEGEGGEEKVKEECEDEGEEA